MAYAVVRQIDESYLPALRMFAGHIEQSHLSTIQRVGIVESTNLNSTHHA